MTGSAKYEVEKNRESLYKEKISAVFSQIIDEIGLENALKIARIAGGGNLYIPTVETIERPWRDKQIRNEFNGYNFKELSLKYNKSVSTIRYICKDLAYEYRKSNHKILTENEKNNLKHSLK